MEVETRAVGLSRMREAQGLTRQELATKFGLTLEGVEFLESGFTTPSPQLRRVLMAYFDCHFEDLFAVLSIQMDDPLQGWARSEPPRGA